MFLAVLHSQHHIDILNEKSIGKEHLTLSSPSDLSKRLFWDSVNKFKMSHQRQTRNQIFQGRGGFGELEHFYKHSVKNLRRKGRAVENFGVFSPRYS